jgi:hypothetical protein
MDRFNAIISDATMLNWFSLKRVLASSFKLAGMTTAWPPSPGQCDGFLSEDASHEKQRAVQSIVYPKQSQFLLESEPNHWAMKPLAFFDCNCFFRLRTLRRLGPISLSVVESNWNFGCRTRRCASVRIETRWMSRSLATDGHGILICFVQSENNMMKKTSIKIQNNDVQITTWRYWRLQRRHRFSMMSDEERWDEYDEFIVEFEHN